MTTAITTIKRFLGQSTDDKPTTAPAGSTFFEFNTGFMWIFTGSVWVPKSFMPESTVNYNEVGIATADDFDVMTATAQDLFIDAVIVHVPDDLSGVTLFTSLKVETDDATPIEIMAVTAKANLTGNFYHIFRGPVVTAATSKIIATTVGVAGVGKAVDITVMWRPLVAGGYYLNA